MLPKDDIAVESNLMPARLSNRVALALPRARVHPERACWDIPAHATTAAIRAHRRTRAWLEVPAIPGGPRLRPPQTLKPTWYKTLAGNGAHVRNPKVPKSWAKAFTREIMSHHVMSAGRWGIPLIDPPRAGRRRPDVVTATRARGHHGASCAGELDRGTLLELSL